MNTTVFRTVAIAIFLVGIATVAILGSSAQAGADESTQPVGPVSDVRLAKQETAPSVHAAPDKPSRARNFRLQDHRGASHELYRMKDATAIVLVSMQVGCPHIRAIAPDLLALQSGYGDRGVKAFLLDSNPKDTRDAIGREMNSLGLTLPVLLDDAQLVAKTYGIQRTAECVLIDPSTWTVTYHGAASGMVGTADTRRDYLKAALDAVLTGDSIETPRTESGGCLIKPLPNPRRISYRKDIAPLLQEKCAGCHVEGNIAPFAMDSYEQVAKRSRMIREVLMTKRMPPWHADPHYGQFANDSSLDREDLRTLVAWLDADAPRGDGDDPLLKNAEAVPASEWPLGKPDLIFEMPHEVHIPAQGVLDYEYARVRYTGSEDMWVQAADILPGNRSVVHHALVFIEYPRHLKHLQPDNEGGLNGFFAAYVPGMHVGFYPKGTGKYVPAGSEFIFQMHYTTTGRAQTDRSSLGLYLCKTKPAREYHHRSATNVDFAIAPRDPHSTTEASYEFERDAVLYELGPHMHLRGKEFRYELRYPDGKTDVLLSVPNYDFNWQTMYRLEKPVNVPAGSEIYCTGAFDNSANNPNNPDPNRTVYFGDQTFDEMFIGYIGYALKDKGLAQEHETASGTTNMGVPITSETLVNTVWQTGRFKLFFFAGGEMRVGKMMKGTWRIDGDKLIIHVGREDHYVQIDGDQLLTDDGPMLFLSGGAGPS